MNITHEIKNHKSAILLSLVLASSIAKAQTNVTLYGVADANIEYVNHFSTVTLSATNGFSTGPSVNRVRLNSGGLSGSRFGLRGNEDLGGGLSAFFALEAGFSLDTGTGSAGRLFGRQAFVGLNSKSVGSFTFGRQYTSFYDGLENFAPLAFVTQYEPTVAVVGADFRSDNMAKYTGVFGPVTACAHWTFGNGVAGNGEVPGQFHRDSGYGASLVYASGPFAATAGYNQYNPTLSAAGDIGSVKKAAVAASYMIGERTKVMAGYRWGQNTDGNGATLLRDDLYWAGVNYVFNPGMILKLGYYYDDIKRFGNSNMKNPWQLSLIADYSLSKRTDIYLTTAYAKNAGLNFDTSAIGFANGYFLGSGHSSMLGAAVGIRHKF